MDEKRLLAKLRKQWDVSGLVSDLRKSKWARTEPNRIDRLSWIGSYETLKTMARDTFPEKEWKEAEQEGMEDEVIDEYLDAVAHVVMDAMGKDLRREHVYATFAEGDAYLGQYEDISAEELEAMGFEIGNA